MSNNPKAALAGLRQKMQEKQLDYYLIGSSDPHNNEYVPAHWRYLEEVSGFSGSLGYLLVSQEFAGLWVDSRYHIQAGRECPTGIRVFRLGKSGVPSLHDYWQQCLTSSAKQLHLGFDGTCFSRQNVKNMLSVAAAFGGVVDDSSLKIDDLWLCSTDENCGQNPRPARPQTPVYDYKLEYCGQSRQDKILQVRKIMHLANYDYYPISLLDNIAWLLNVRASDIDYNPLAISYLMLGQQSLCWYVENIGAELATELRRDIPELQIKSYSEFYPDCQSLLLEHPCAIFLLTDRCNMRLFNVLLSEEQQEKCNGGKRLERGIPPCSANRDIITDLKTVKNATEQQQLRKIMVLDGAAMVAFHNWLRPRQQSAQTENLAAQDLPLNEYQLAQKLVEFRRQIAAELGRGESFAPIVGFGENSALPHYTVTPAKSSSIYRQDGWILLDSGGQYLGGTTDMTRCFSLNADFSPPSFAADLRLIYTLVLRGHLQLQNARFPKGTLGVQLDTLARNPLWSRGLNYLHGTGHGVGSFLNVHEGPASISSYPLNEPLQAGMLVSNEPGYYREGHFGIRIENLMLVQVDKINPEWLCFEPVTFFPYERELICLEHLSSREMLWLDQYHKNCEKYILASAKLNTEQEEWLRWRCSALITI